MTVEGHICVKLMRNMNYTHTWSMWWRVVVHVLMIHQRIPILLSSDPMELIQTIVSFWQNIQSTNWQTMRFKPPPPNSNIGWRVEFRPMEVKLPYNHPAKKARCLSVWTALNVIDLYWCNLTFLLFSVILILCFLILS